MNVYKDPVYDDFTGFTFNGQHSSQFGLLRVSNSDRYEDDLVLSHSNEAADIPGGPGQYYWGESVKNRAFPINVAYDNIGEADKRRIKKWLHPDDKLHELIFDERPYVKYWVKCSKQVTAKELCFNEVYESGQDIYGKPIEKIRRVYKGEFDIEFTAYMPYGIEVSKSLDDFKSYNNIDEWAESSGLVKEPPQGFKVNEEDISIKAISNIYNPGDIESGFELIGYMPSQKVILEYMSVYGPTETLKKINDTIENLDNNIYIYVNNKLSLLELNAEFPYVQTDNGTEKGTIVQENGVSKYESEITGDLLDLYKYVPDTGYFVYNSPIDLSGRYLALNEELKQFEIEVLSTQEIETGVYTVNINSLTGEDLANQTLYLPLVSSWVSDFYLNNIMSPCRFTLTIPSAATIQSKDWSKAQEFLFNGGHLKIDSNKQTISWCPDGSFEWSGIAGIISNGSLFKIPTDDWIDSTEEYNKFIIDIDKSLQPLDDLVLNYNYLYK